VFAAFGARALARRLGSDGTAAFWIISVASHATIYALDFWEHSIGLALVVWAVVAALDASDGDRGVGTALLAGLGFGLAGTMRQEPLVYGFVAGSCVGGRLLLSGRLLGATTRGATMVAGVGAMTLVNSALDSALIGDATRAGRSTSTAAAAGGDLTLRAEEAVVTFASPFAQTEVIFLILAVLTAATLATLGHRADGPADSVRPIAIMAGALGALVLVDMFGNGLGFVPGLSATTPVAALALTRGWGDSDRRFVMLIALASLTLVWAVQYTGGAGPQWGGRYILTTGALLVVMATVVFTSDMSRSVLRATALAGLAITLLGAA
jgi:hypothetical protein